MRYSRNSYLFLLNTIIFFSTYEVVNRAIAQEIDLIQVNFLRFLIGGLFLLPFAVLSMRGRRPDVRSVLAAVPVGVLNVCISMTFLQLSIIYSGAAIAAVVFSCNPIFVATFSQVILGEKMSRNKTAGLVFGIAGVTVTFLDGLLSGNIISMGVLFAILSAIIFGLYTVLGKRVSEPLGSTMMNSVSFISGSLILMPILYLTNKPIFNFSQSALVPLIYLSICVTGIAYLTYFAALREMPANVGSSVFFVKPIAASLLAVVFLGEMVTPFLLLGGLLVLAGIYLTLFFERGKRTTKS
ncbi:MAG TPA: EamA family transporter [Candidatus Bathyarchaeia archaeon]|nr:EamA family transporter [Candidatus Bathyarchaeia archaeon]